MSKDLVKLNQADLVEQVKKDFWVNPIKVRFVNEENRRETGFELAEDMKDMERSIDKNGVKTPVTLYRIKPELNDGYEYQLVHGYRRMNAVTSLIKENPKKVIKVPAIVIVKPTDLEILLDHITLNSGKPLPQNELAKIIIDLETKFGLSRAEISTYTGFTQARISQIVKFKEMLDNDSQLKAIAKKGLIAPSELNDQIKKSEDIEETKAIIEIAMEEAEKTGKKKVTKKDIEAVKNKLAPTPEVQTEIQKEEIGEEIIPETPTPKVIDFGTIKTLNPKGYNKEAHIVSLKNIAIKNILGELDTLKNEVAKTGTDKGLGIEVIKLKIEELLKETFVEVFGK
jgi:hypothetical protein